MSAKAKYAWLDGEFVPWEQARIHVRSDCVMHGASVFEGVRGYWNAAHGELCVVKLSEHMTRLAESTKMLRMELPYSLDVVAEASVELLRRCAFREDVHFRPTVYFGEGEPYSVDPSKIFVGAFVTAVPRPQRPALERGIHLGVSSWQRINDQSVPPRIKASANYLNSRLAMVQARLDGYDDAVLLNERGKVAETGAACIMLVRHGRVITPSVTDNILESITRSSLIQLFRDELGIAVEERDVDRTELYVADELFECGTGHEITPVVSIDRYPVGSGQRGPITRRIQELYFAIVRGDLPSYRHWLRPTYGSC